MFGIFSKKSPKIFILQNPNNIMLFFQRFCDFLNPLLYDAYKCSLDIANDGIWRRREDQSLIELTFMSIFIKLLRNLVIFLVMEVISINDWSSHCLQVLSFAISNELTLIEHEPSFFSSNVKSKSST